MTDALVRVIGVLKKPSGVQEYVSVTLAVVAVMVKVHVS
jgi:hypothetical protein